MTVKELIEKLEIEDLDRVVIMQKDGEGNGYSPLDDMWTGSYAAITSYFGRAGLEELTDDDRASGYGPEDVLEGVSALILIPIH